MYFSKSQIDFVKKRLIKTKEIGSPSNKKSKQVNRSLPWKCQNSTQRWFFFASVFAQRSIHFKEHIFFEVFSFILKVKKKEQKSREQGCEVPSTSLPFWSPMSYTVNPCFPKRTRDSQNP